MNLEENKTLFPDEAITIFLCIDGDEPELSGRIEDIRNKIRFRGQEEILCTSWKALHFAIAILCSLEWKSTGIRYLFL